MVTISISKLHKAMLKKIVIERNTYVTRKVLEDIISEEYKKVMEKEPLCYTCMDEIGGQATITVGMNCPSCGRV